MLNICKFQKYLGNSRKRISQNKEFKFSHLENHIKEKPYKPINVKPSTSFPMEHMGLTK